MDPKPRDTGSVVKQPSLNTDAVSYYGIVGFGCAVLALWLVLQAPGRKVLHRLLFFPVVFCIGTVGGFHLAAGYEELQRPIHRDMPTGEIAFGLLCGLVLAVAFWVRAHYQRAREPADWELDSEP